MSRLTVPQGAAVSIGAVLGTGVIALPALGARTAGPASLLAWLGLIALSIPLAAAFAALGSRYPDAGGVSTYVRKAFGARPAAMVGWCLYFAVTVGAPPAAMFAGAYVSAVLGGGTRTTLITAGAIMLVVTAANAGGVRISGRVQLGLSVVLVSLLLVATLTALPHAHVENLRPFAPHGWLAVGSAAAVLVWGFAGWEAVTSLAADFRNPARDLRRATAIALVVVGVLYLGVATASVLVLGPHTGTSGAPLAELLSIGIGGRVDVITAAVAVLLTIGTMNAYYAGGAKLGAALARDGALPAWLARGSQAGEVPRRSLALLAGVGGVALVVVGLTGLGPEPLVLLTTGSFATVYVMAMASAVRLLPRGSAAARAALVALVAVIGLVVMIGAYMAWTGLVALLALAYLWRRERRDRAAHRRTSVEMPGATPGGVRGGVPGVLVTAAESEPVGPGGEPCPVPPSDLR